MLNVVLIPVIVGGWSDVIDISEMLRGHWEVSGIVGASFIIFLIGLYLYLHGCAFYIQYKQQEESQDAERKKEHFESEKEELICQRDFLLRLLSFFREVVGNRLESISTVLNSGAPSMQQILEPAWQVDRYVDAIRMAYMPLFNAESSLRVVLLKIDADRLEPVYSYDGTRRRWFDISKSDNAEAFRHSNVMNNLAVNAAKTGTILIIEDTSKAAEQSQPFRFYGNEEKRARQQAKIRRGSTDH